MVETFNNILDLADRFDVFFFDAYGVLWNGNSFFDGVFDSLNELISRNKIVYILSNTTKISSSAEAAYYEKGLIKGKYYNEIITSGEFTRSVLLNDNLHFNSNKNPRKCYIFGNHNKKLFNGTNYTIVDNIKDADFIYVSTVSIAEEDYNKISNEDRKFLVKLVSSKDGSWRMTDLRPLIPQIDDIIVKSGLPVLLSNPDYKAINSVVGFKEQVATLTPGTVGKYLKSKNIEVLEFGKPYIGIYEFAFSELLRNGISVDKSKICMVGDTLRTDVKGANNAGINSVLCIETGITADELKSGKNIDDLIKEENVKVDYFINCVGNC